MAAPPPLAAPSMAHMEPEKELDETMPGEIPPSPAPSISKEEANVASDFKPGLRLYLAFLVLAVLTLMVALDGTSLSVALPIIAQKLHGTAIEAFWAGTSFLLTATVFQPSFGSLSDIFGRRPMVLAALALFLVGVLLAATANNFTLLLAGRAIQGIGGGGILTLTEIIVTDLVPLRERGKWVGIIAGMWSVGSVSGPIIGGVFSQSVTWRWIFWINLPFIGVAAVLIPLFLKLNFIPSSLTSKLRRVDWVGQVLFIGSTTSFLIPISWGGVQEPWTSWRTLVPLIIGIVGLICFVCYEIFLAKEPVIRISVFGNQTSAISYFIDLLHGMILWSMLYYQPLYYEAVKGYSPIISGVALFPATFTVAPMAVVTGFLITITGKYRWAIWIGWAATIAGLGLDTLLDVNTPVYQWVLINLVPGVGLGMLFPSMQFSLQASSEPKNLAFAVALFSFFRTFGQAIGVAISGTIFQNQMKLKLLKYPHYASQAGALAKDAAALVQIIKQTPAGQDKLDLQISYVQSVRTIYIVMCALAGVALFAALFIKAYDLNRALESEQGLVTEKKSRTRAVEEGISVDTA